MPVDSSFPAEDIKLRELILYISEKSEGDLTFGAVKLNKLLFYADFSAFVQLGRSITGQEYQKLKHGPAPRRLKPVMDLLEGSGEVGIRKVEYDNRRQHRPFALREPDLDVFTGTEIELVNRIMARFRDTNATEISEKSHRFAGWALAEEGETVPYEVALVGRRPASDSDAQWCDSLVESARECRSRDAQAGL